MLSDENRRTEYNNVLGNLGTRPPSAPAAAAGRSFCAAGQQHQQRYTRPSTARCSQSYSYTVHQQDISNMMRRDADAARKGMLFVYIYQYFITCRIFNNITNTADRNSREFSRWRTQYAAHQNASEMAKAAAAGPSPRPSSASFKEQRQHVLQQQVQTLWQMHQRRWSKAGVKNNTFREENTQNSIDQPKQQAEEELREEALRTARQQQQQDDEKRLREEHVMELLRKEQMDFADKIKNNSTNSTNTTNTTNTMDDTNSCSNCSRSSSPISTSSFSSNSAVSLSFESTTKIKSPAAETVRKSTPASSPSPPPPPLPTHSFTADATVISSSVSVIDTLPTDTEVYIVIF